MSDEIKDYIERADKKRQEQDEIEKWHLRIHAEAGIKLPYFPFDTYVSANVYNDETYELDVDATLDNLARIVQYGTDNAISVEKDYGHSFQVRVKIADRVTINYNAERDAVCTKKVVGTKVIPAQPERVEDEVEWECEKIAFLARQV
jgi:hypothetical protein